jgi:hypothetical protein
MPPVPPRKPGITYEETARFLAESGVPTIDRAALFGRRGWFVDYGEPGNDYGVFDDAIVLISPTAFVTTTPTPTRR